jgi:hypothetical protein
VPDAPQVTETVPKDDGTGDLNHPPTVNYDYGLDKENNIDQPLAQDIKLQAHNPIQDPVKPPQDAQDEFPNKREQVKPDPPLPSEQHPKAPDQGVIGLHHSSCVCYKPQRLVPTLGRKSYESTAAVTTHLIHPDNHMDQAYVLVAHCIMTQYSLKAGMKRFKERGKEDVTKDVSQLHYQDTY